MAAWEALLVVTREPQLTAEMLTAGYPFGCYVAGDLYYTAAKRRYWKALHMSCARTFAGSRRLACPSVLSLPREEERGPGRGFS